MSSVFGICMVKNAEDVIGYIVEHMIGQVDQVIVADNLSSDNTRSILEDIKSKSHNLTIVDDNDPAYRQSEKMTALAMQAKAMGAEWVVPFDADEWWFSKEGTLRDVIVNANFDIYTSPMYDHRPTGVDSTDPNPMKRIGWRCADPGPMRKVACRARDDLTILMGNHNATYDNNPAPTVYHDVIEIRHFPYRTAEQFVDKAVTGAKALNITDLPYWQGAHWRDYYKIYQEHGEEALKGVFREWFWSADPSNQGFVYDPIVT